MALQEYNYSGGSAPSVLTRTAWSNILHKQVQNKLYWRSAGFIGPDKGDEDYLDAPKGHYPIVTREELGKNGGDKIVVPLLRQLSGSGVTGNTALKDAEEALDFWSFSAYIELKRHATGWVHKMSPQRNRFHQKQQVADLLSSWMAQEMDDSVFDALYNKYSAHLITEVGVSSTTHPNEFFAGSNAYTDIDELTDTDVFDTSVLERAATWAEENNINPVNVDGEECFVMIIHPRQLHTLRADEEWKSSVRSGEVRGPKNPMFTRAEGKYAGVLVHCTNKIQVPTTGSDTANKRGAIFLGAHAVARAVGQRPEIVQRDDTDYGRVSAWGIDAIWGDTRCDFTEDAGSPSTSNQSSAIFWTMAPGV